MTKKDNVYIREFISYFFFILFYFIFFLCEFVSYLNQLLHHT